VALDKNKMFNFYFINPTFQVRIILYIDGMYNHSFTNLHFSECQKGYTRVSEKIWITMLQPTHTPGSILCTTITRQTIKIALTEAAAATNDAIKKAAERATKKVLERAPGNIVNNFHELIFAKHDLGKINHFFY
jgi:hypothetical protein